MASIMILSVSLENVIEPFPLTPDPAKTPGRRQLSFRDPATVPGGKVQLQILPPVDPGDLLPINAYAFFVPASIPVPAPADRTPDWFFKSGAPSGSIHLGSADESGALDITVPGVLPSLDPYFVQIVVEFKST